MVRQQFTPSIEILFTNVTTYYYLVPLKLRPQRIPHLSLSAFSNACLINTSNQIGLFHARHHDICRLRGVRLMRGVDIQVRVELVR